jgi:hypothetical protein
VSPAPEPKGPKIAHADEAVLVRLAYRELLEAGNDANGTRGGQSNHPVRSHDLCGKGVPHRVLQGMMYHGHLDHLRPTSANDEQAILGPVDSVVPKRDSAFCLTRAGHAFAAAFLASWPEADSPRPPGDILLVGRLTPTFHKDERLLVWGCHVVKCFRQPARSQELVLLGAEEVGWSAWFDNPLSRRGPCGAKARLHNTIKDLNNHQRTEVLRFKGDGSGHRFGWELR